MKGSYFKSEIECHLNIDGESWRQGDLIRGKLLVTNKGEKDMSLSNCKLQFSLNDVKKMRKGETKSAKIINELQFESSKVLKKEETESISWKYPLEKNATISTKKESYFILFGETSKYPDCGILELTVLPHSIIEYYLDLWEKFHRFKIKEIKDKNGVVTVKMIPPGSKEYLTLLEMIFQLELKNNLFVIKFNYNVQKINFVSGNANVDKSTKEFIQELKEKDIVFEKDSYNQEYLLNSINEALKEIKSQSKVI